MSDTQVAVRLARPEHRLVGQPLRDIPGARLLGDLRRRGHALRQDGRHQVADPGGQLTTPQVQVIVDALDELERAFKGDPQIVNAAELLAKAEQALVDEAPRLSLSELKVVGERIMAYVAPDRVDEAERKRLEEAERRAAAATQLRMRDRGDGTVHLFVRMPKAEATRLRTYLDAFTSPRTDALENGFIDPATGTRLPADRLRGEAFIALLHTMDPARMPIHGGDATTMIVTLGLEVLTKGLGTAMLGDGTRISASQARLLACKAGIIPAVMGGRSEVLDLGRSKRLFTRAQRVAKVLAHKTCQVEGCDHPAAWCEVHHRDPWAKGGRTDLEKAVLARPWHHHRIHDPAYTTTYLSDGAVRFHRRT
ncbi:HNH endonuclease signature motif containing protein [Nocardioides gansuensis]|uniref:HNH endonuclease signature motif containing protein n=1 Tax=Nocardioides gansuensis TaxID=2138300 RepID=UPI001404200F|nr:HNH endonuclease signature motif containing protein [Nocardioides gansuensis]